VNVSYEILFGILQLQVAGKHCVGEKTLNKIPPWRD